MAMSTDCLVKLKPLVSDTVYAKLDEAVQTGDQKTWDFTMNDAHADMKLLKADAILDANKKAGILEYLKSQKANNITPAQALLDLVSGSGVRQKSGVVSLDKYIEGVQGGFIAKNIDLIDANKPTLMGLRRAGNPEATRNIVKGIFGDADASIPKGGQAIIDAWHQTTKAILERFNKAGGRISELKGFNIPVNHFSPKMLKVGEDAWVTDALNLFDVRKMGGMPAISDEALLRKVYRNITTEGAELGEGTTTMGKKLGNSHQEFRVLQPKSGDAWLKYNDKYGIHSNPIDSMKEYINSMSTEIGLMEVFGTNPTKMLDDMAGEVARVSGNPRSGSMAKAALDHIRSRTPRAEDGITNTFRGLRNIQTITKLPLAGVTAMSDVGFTATRAMYLGMKPTRIFARHMKNLATSGDYKTAGRLGLMADYANHMAVAANRFTDSMGFSKLDRVTDFSMRANGLNHWTNSARSTFGMEFLANLSDQGAKSFNDLPRGMKSALQRYGFTDTDWDKMSKARTSIEGTNFVDPTSELLDDSLKARILGMIKEETNFAVPEPNAKARAIAAAGTRTNTVANEMIRTMTQFKSFGISILTSHMGMLLDKGLPTPTKMAYGASLLTSTTVMGAIVLQLKDIAKGREPRELSPTLFAQGALQGGFLGVAGDMIFDDPRLFGGLPGKIAGPTVGDANRIWKVFHSTKDEVLKEGGNWQKELFPAIESAAEEVAFPLRLWSTRVAAERLMLDQVRRFTDPDYYSKLQRTKKWLRKEKGQGFWSTPK